ncbi:MAG: hypothetical protein MUP81_02915 [Dehalococcoidia bacterium]|nr:hypothetical protein [Dehalococcoidia bacterium]
MPRPRCIDYENCKAVLQPYENPEAPKFRGIKDGGLDYLPSLCDTCYSYEPEVQPEVEIKYIPLDPREYQSRLKKLEERMDKMDNVLIKKTPLTPPLKKRFTYDKVKLDVS